MRKNGINRLFVVAILTTSFTSLARADAPQGTVQVVVQNESGAPTPNAPVYLSDSRGNHFFVTDQSGALTISLPEGSYRLSSAMSVKDGDIVDRFASPEAQVQVAAGDLTSVILHLSALPDAVSSMELSTLRKIGVDAELAKDLN